MHRRALGTCLLVLLVAASGCNGLLDGGPNRGTYEVPERTPTVETTATGDDDASAAVESAPGTNGVAFRDPRAVSSAHARYLSNRSFTVTVNRTVQYPNGSVDVTVSRLAVDAGRRLFHLSRNRSPVGDDPVLVELWGNGQTLYRSVSTPGDRYRHGGSQVVPVGDGARPCGIPSIPDPTFRSWIRDAFADTSATGLRRADNSRLYLVRASGDRGRTIGGVGDGAATDLRMEAIVDAPGLVRYLWVAYETRVGDTSANVTLTLRFGDVGSTAVETRRGLGDGQAGPGPSSGVCPPRDE